jgi:hypothetical protein
MRKRSFRWVITAAVLCMSAFLLACPMGRLRLQIPDYFTSDVQGVQLYRIDDASGELVDAGRIEFIKVEKQQNVDYLKYRHVSPEGDPWWGPVYTPINRIPNQPNGIEIELAFLNQLPSGWFKVASYNLIGTSRASAAQTFVAAGAEG